MTNKNNLIGLHSNLAYIQEIKLVDGTVLRNKKVLFNSPIPTTTQLEGILSVASDASGRILGEYESHWSDHPEYVLEFKEESETQLSMEKKNELKEIKKLHGNISLKLEHISALSFTLLEFHSSLRDLNAEDEHDRLFMIGYETNRRSYQTENLLNLLDTLLNEAQESSEKLLDALIAFKE